MPHRHVVMTLPHILLDLVKRNRKEMLNILMRTSAETLKDWMMHKFGLKTGVIAVLHTYGETKQLHVHTHMIMSWGGIDNDGKIVIPEHDYVHIPSICKVFRYKFEHALIGLFDAGRLEHDFHDRMEFMGFIKKGGEQKGLDCTFGAAHTDAGTGDTICGQVFQTGVSERVQDYGNGRRKHFIPLP